MHKRSDGSPVCSYSYTLDAVGNITYVAANEPLSPVYQPESSSQTHDDGNRLISDGEFTYTYDNNGNLVQRSGASGTTTFTYNHENLMTDISGASSIANVYNGLGQRIARTHNGAQIRYVLDVAASLPGVLAETDSSGVAKAYYVYGLGLISRITPSGWRQIYHFNHRGDTIAITEGSGAITDTYAYDEFGQQLNRTGSTQNPFTFVGKFGVMDEGDGFYFMRARYYEAGLGRFLSEDPSSSEMNQYLYAKNNPLLFVDPNGRNAVVLLARDAVGGHGHIAIAVKGKSNWIYFSVGAVGLWNGSVYGLTTLDTIHNSNIGSLVRLINSTREKQGAKAYTDFFYIRQSAHKDQAMINYIQQWYLSGSPERYNLTENNCKDFVRGVLNAGGISTADYTRPNDFFDNIGFINVLTGSGVVRVKNPSIVGFKGTFAETAPESLDN